MWLVKEGTKIKNHCKEARITQLVWGGLIENSSCLLEAAMILFTLMWHCWQPSWTWHFTGTHSTD